MSNWGVATWRPVSIDNLEIMSYTETLCVRGEGMMGENSGQIWNSQSMKLEIVY